MNLLRYIPGTEKVGVVTFSILSNKVPIRGSVRVNSIYVCREVNKIPYAKIVIFDGDVSKEEFAVSDSDVFTPGNEIIVRAGYDSLEKTIFKGVVVKHSIRNKMNRSSILEVDCRDIAVRMTVGRKNKYFTGEDDEVTDSDVMEEILREVYRSDIASGNFKFDIESTKVTHSKLVQYYATDWDFIVSRAEANGKVVIADNGFFKVESPSLTQIPSLTVFYGNSVFEFEAEIDARNQFKEVVGVSWDPASGEVIEEEGNFVIPATARQGNLTADELANVVDAESYLMQHSGAVSNAELKAWADAKMLKSRLSKVRGKIKIQGTASVAPGDLITMAGFGSKFNGTAYVSSVWQEIYDGVWYTTVQVGLDFKWFASDHDIEGTPAAAMLPAVSGLQVGIVTQLENDPESEERILVKLPVLDNQAQGVWARVAREYAGLNRGLVFLPEIGDEVIVGFINDDPRDPIILGAMHSSNNPSPIEASDENNEKVIVSREGMTILFNEEDQSVSVFTAKGKKVLLDDKNGILSLSDENNNVIEMSSEGISIESTKAISIKAGTDVKIEGTNISGVANAELSLEGNTTAKLSSGAQTIVEGAIVSIN